jgi:glycosyltransferase involved in cell wall biosynthesis
LIVCYFGPFDPVLTRNRVIIKGLIRNNVEVIQCNTLSSNSFLDYIKILKQLRFDYDVLMLGARGDRFGQPLVPLLKKITGKPVVFDAMISLYETDVIDRALVRQGTFKSSLWHYLDFAALDSADMVLSDTDAHSRSYAAMFNVEVGKFKRVFVGTDDDVFYPRVRKKRSDCFTVMFWGSFIPLHGIEYIIKSAKLLEKYRDIEFKFRGYGQTFESSIELAKCLKLFNVSFDSNWVSHEELPDYISNADVCLGNFGDTEKAKCVITSKSIDAIAMKKPLITGDSPAAEEVFRNRENCLLVPMANSEALADAILEIKENKKLREKIADNGYILYKERLNPVAIGRELKCDLLQLVNKSD